MVQQVLSALSYIHNESIVHWDVKSANIFIKYEGNDILVKLGDFGLSRKVSIESSKFEGTEAYAAIEQKKGLNWNTKK